MNKYKIPLLFFSLLLTPSFAVMAEGIPSSPPTSSPPHLHSSTISTTESPKVPSPGSPEATTPPKSGHSYCSIHVSEPYIAMTFDDGPHPTLTPKLLDLLKEKGIKATFFLIGENVALYPNIVKRMVDEGHEVASHTWSHPALNKCSPAKFNHELTAANEAIQSACGIQPTLIRPPYGATNSNLDRTMDEKYKLKVILWSVDPLDWKFRNSERVTHYILAHTKPGDIILAHDIHATTVAAMPRVFDTLLQKGFKFVTVTQLMAHQTAAPLAQKTTSSSTSSPLSPEEPATPLEIPEAPSLNPSAAPVVPSLSSPNSVHPPEMINN